MFSKSNLIATLVGAITLFLAGYLIWGLATVELFKPYIVTDVSKDPPLLGFIALGNLVGAFAMSTLYGKWARGKHSAKEGIEFGALIGLFVGFGSLLIMYATANIMNLTGHLIEGFLEIIFYAIGGMIIAIIYKATS